MIDIPKRFEEAEITDWPEDSAIRKVCVKYLNNFDEFYTQGMAPSFFGVSGVGKSRAAAALLRTVKKGSDPPLSVGWFPASETFNRLLDYRDMWQKEVYNAIWSSLTKTDLICIDDISTLRKSNRLYEYFWMVIESRYSDLRPTIYTANLTPTAEKDLWDNLSEWFSVPFSRRLNETTKGLFYTYF